MALHTKKDDEEIAKDEEVVDLSTAGEDPTDDSDAPGGIDTAAAEEHPLDPDKLIMHAPGPHDEGAGTIMHPVGPHYNGAGQIEHTPGPSPDAPPAPEADPEGDHKDEEK